MFLGRKTQAFPCNSRGGDNPRSPERLSCRWHIAKTCQHVLGGSVPPALGRVRSSIAYSALARAPWQAPSLERGPDSAALVAEIAPDVVGGRVLKGGWESFFP